MPCDYPESCPALGQAITMIQGTDVQLGNVIPSSPYIPPAYAALLLAAEQLISGAESGVADITLLEQLGEAVDAIHRQASNTTDQRADQETSHGK